MGEKGLKELEACTGVVKGYLEIWVVRGLGDKD